jgi:hypothetical protein
MASDIESIIQWMDDLSKQHISIPEIAGPKTWNYLHTLAKLTPPDKVSQERAFNTLKQVVDTFPCSECSEHGMIYINEHPFNGNLEEYVCDFHNTVNEHLGKPIHACEIGFSQPITENPPQQHRSKHHKRREVLRTSPEKIMSRGIGEIDGTLVEAVPYITGDVGVSIPMGPLPGAPSIEFSAGPDFPLTIFPIPYHILNFLSDPWQYERPLTPKEYLNTMFEEEPREEPENATK